MFDWLTFNRTWASEWCLVANAHSCHVITMLTKRPATHLRLWPFSEEADSHFCSTGEFGAVIMHDWLTDWFVLICRPKQPEMSQLYGHMYTGKFRYGRDTDKAWHPDTKEQRDYCIIVVSSIMEMANDNWNIVNFNNVSHVHFSFTYHTGPLTLAYYFILNKI